MSWDGPLQSSKWCTVAGRINKVTLHRARLLLRRVTIREYSVLVCSQPLRKIQPSKPFAHVKQNKCKCCNKTSTSVFGTDVYPHMPILRQHAARFHERRISSVTFESAHLYGNVYMRVGVARALADSPADFGPIWASGRAKFTKNVWFPALNTDEPPCKIWRR